MLRGAFFVRVSRMSRDPDQQDFARRMEIRCDGAPMKRPFREVLKLIAAGLVEADRARKARPEAQLQDAKEGASA